MDKKILLVANTCWYLVNFRLPLLRDLSSEGFIVEAVAPHDQYTSYLEAEGIKVHHWGLSRRSINPLPEFLALVDLFLIYRREAPQLVHHFTIKACLYGTIAAKCARIYRVVNSVTGLGHLFVSRRKRTRVFRRILQPLYRSVFSARRSTVVFQNADDQERLILLGITNSHRSRLIRGSGVDIDHFQPILDSAGNFSSPLKILFPSRLIREKGIQNLLEACQSLWSLGFSLELHIAGVLDDGNPSSLRPSELDLLRSESRIRFLGHVDDMRSLYESSDVVILPSWREGLSRSLIEAASMERPIITTDVPGCNDVVEHGRTGLLVPLLDSHAIALSIILLIRNPDFARRLGQAARLKVVKEFQVSLVNSHTIEQYRLLFNRAYPYPSNSRI